MVRSVKFFGKNVNDGKYADYQYLGSVMCADNGSQALIEHAESLGGPVYGPLLAMVEGEQAIRVLQV